MRRFYLLYYLPIMLLLQSTILYTQAQTLALGHRLRLIAHRDEGKVHFALHSREVSQFRLQVFNPLGIQLYDSDFVEGQVVTWQMTNQQEQDFPAGQYIYTATVKDISGNYTVEQGAFNTTGRETEGGDGGGEDDSKKGRKINNGVLQAETNACTGPLCTIVGGESNTASGYASTIVGGIGNTASGNASTILGGGFNISSGAYAATVGGNFNEAAGLFSFAGGRRAKVSPVHPGTFLFADSNDFNFNSAAANEVAARATGGFRFITGIDGGGNPTSGLYVLGGSGNVGIGTASPSSKLDVNGNTNANGYQVNGVALAASHLSNGATGSGSVVLGTDPSISNPTVITGMTLGGGASAIFDNPAGSQHNLQIYKTGGVEKFRWYKDATYNDLFLRSTNNDIDLFQIVHTPPLGFGRPASRSYFIPLDSVIVHNKYADETSSPQSETAMYFYEGRVGSDPHFPDGTGRWAVGSYQSNINGRKKIAFEETENAFDFVLKTGANNDPPWWIPGQGGYAVPVIKLLNGSSASEYGGGAGKAAGERGLVLYEPLMNNDPTISTDASSTSASVPTVTNPTASYFAADLSARKKITTANAQNLFGIQGRALIARDSTANDSAQINAGVYGFAANYSTSPITVSYLQSVYADTPFLLEPGSGTNTLEQAYNFYGAGIGPPGAKRQILNACGLCLGAVTGGTSSNRAIKTLGGDVEFDNANLTVSGAITAGSGVTVLTNSTGTIKSTALEPFDGAAIYHQANQSLNNNTPTALVMNSERFDNNTLHDTSTNNSRIMIAKAGKYIITGNVVFESNAAGYRMLHIRINGSTYIATNSVPALNGDITGLNVSCIYHLAVGDYVELIALQTSGESLNILVDQNRSPELRLQWIGN